jgi:hypothetical protein
VGELGPLPTAFCCNNANLAITATKSKVKVLTIPAESGEYRQKAATLKMRRRTWCIASGSSMWFLVAWKRAASTRRSVSRAYPRPSRTPIREVARAPAARVSAICRQGLNCSLCPNPDNERPQTPPCLADKLTRKHRAFGMPLTPSSGPKNLTTTHLPMRSHKETWLL